MSLPYPIPPRDDAPAHEWRVWKEAGEYMHRVRSKRAWTRFSLRTLMIVVTLTCIALWVNVNFRIRIFACTEVHKHRVERYTGADGRVFGVLCLEPWQKQIRCVITGKGPIEHESKRFHWWFKIPLEKQRFEPIEEEYP